MLIFAHFCPNLERNLTFLFQTGCFNPGNPSDPPTDLFLFYYRDHTPDVPKRYIRTINPHCTI